MQHCSMDAPDARYRKSRTDEKGAGRHRPLQTRPLLIARKPARASCMQTAPHVARVRGESNALS
jgi:hypothetical protein